MNTMKTVKKIALCLIAACVAASAWAKTGDTMYVNVKKSALRKGASLFSGKAGAVAYGDKVTVTAEKGSWVEAVRADNSSVKGWIPLSSLTKKKIVLQNGRSSVSASADELALAGKGFSADVENAFKKTKNGLRYDAVDRVEQNTVSDSVLYEFIEAGQIAGGEQ